MLRVLFRNVYPFVKASISLQDGFAVISTQVGQRPMNLNSVSTPTWDMRVMPNVRGVLCF